MESAFPCDHFLAMRDVKPSSSEGCEECLRFGRRFHGTGHPETKSFEPGETWGWCYADEAVYDPVPGPATRRHIAPPKAR